MFDQIRGDTCFSKIDLRSVYRKFKIREADAQKTSFVTRYGSQVFFFIPFKLTNGLAIYMDMMKRIFESFLDQFVIVFIIDILINFVSKEENQEHLKLVLQTLRNHHLYAKFLKCEFWP